MPMIFARPVCGNRAETSVRPGSRWLSTMLAAFASARRSPDRIRLSSRSKESCVSNLLF